MEDRLTPGALAGLIGAFIQIILGLLIKGFRISPYVFTDYGEVLILGKQYIGSLAFFIGAVCHLLLGSVFGILFSFVIKYTTKRFYLFKGLGIGLTVWTIASGSGTYFKMPVFKELHPLQATVILIGSAIYGLTMAYSLKLLTDNFSWFFTESQSDAKKKLAGRYHLTPASARKLEATDKKIRLKKPIKLR